MRTVPGSRVAANGEQMRLDRQVGSSWMRRRVLALIGALGVLVLAVSSVGATTAAGPGARLVYVTGAARHLTRTVWVADANGSNPVRLVSGAVQAMVSPDGASVALIVPDRSGSGNSLDLVPSTLDFQPAGTPPVLRRLLHAKQFLGVLAWAPDSRKLAVVTDNALAVVDVPSGGMHVMARGQSVDSASFSPSGGQVVYSSFVPNPGGACPNVFIANADGSGVHALTHDGTSYSPLWGPRQIAFARSTSCIGPVPPPAQLWLINPDGHGAHQLTHQRFARRSPGLTSIAWSDDGRRLLAERSDSDAAVSSAWAVDVPSGHARALTSRRQNALAFGLSHDGNTVLATLGPLDDPPHETIATIPWQGGHPHVLVRHAGSPSWTR